MALSGSSTGWAFNNTLFYSFKGKVSSLVLQPQFVHFDMLVVDTRNTYCSGKMKEKTREETVCSVKPMGNSPEMPLPCSDPSSCCLRAMFLTLKLCSRCKN